MITQNFAIHGAKVAAGIVADLLYFPVWWYTRGTARVAAGLFRFLATRQKALGFFVWLKNIFTPMYGQRDFAGALISFFVRLVQIIFRGALLLAWLAVSLGFLAAYLALPLVVAGELIYQLI